MRNGWKYYTRQGSKWNSPPYKVTVAPGVEHSYIGVELTDVSRGVAKSLGADDAGVLVNEVEKDSPAEKAGLLPGDLIVMIDGDEVGESTEVSEIIRSFDEGEKVKLDVIRERKKMNIEVEVGRTEYGSNAPYMFSLPDMPNIDINIPRMKGLHWLNFDDEMFDSDDFKDDMKELRKELEELRLELNELRGDKD